MILTAKQEEGLRISVDRYKQHEKYTIISGYAGSGKTTLVRFIIDALGVDEDDVVYATYTGKAAQVLAQKGNKNVCTLHKLLYKSTPRPDGTFLRRPRTNIEYSIVVVDEISMVPKTLINLLFAHDVYIIGLGDPGQLPPINKHEDNHLLDRPHVFLNEIMRQAKESPIIRLSMDIREHQPIDYINGSIIKVLKKSELSTGMMEWADQILVATNKTRININKQMRQLKGFTSDRPMKNDKVICARNYWDTLSSQENALINGTIGYLKNPYQTFHYLPKYLGGATIDVTMANLQVDKNEQYYNLAMDTHMIMTGDKCIDKPTEYKLSKNPRTKSIPPYEFNYGYAITAHRAQGSEWEQVLVIEENFPFNQEEHIKWLYTACTRASSRLVLLR